MLVYVKTWSVRCTIWNHIAVVSVVLVLVILYNKKSWWDSIRVELQEPVIRVRVAGEFELSEFELSGFYCTLRVAFGLLTVSWDMSTNSLSAPSPPPLLPPLPPHLSPDISINVLRDKLREFDKRSKRFPFSDHFINSHNLFYWLCMYIVRRKLILITLGLIKHYLKFTYQESASQSLISALKTKTAKINLTFVDNSHSQ